MKKDCFIVYTLTIKQSFLPEIKKKVLKDAKIRQLYRIVYKNATIC